MEDLKRFSKYVKDLHQLFNIVLKFLGILGVIKYHNTNEKVISIKCLLFYIVLCSNPKSIQFLKILISQNFLGHRACH